jgi:hypothetical protein
MEIIITGYQYGSNKHFIGEYKFHQHKDHPIQVPPNTTLVAPPDIIIKGKSAKWSGSAWEIVDVDESHITKEQLLPIII